MNTERLDVSTDFDIVNTTVHESVHAMLFYFYNKGEFQSSNTSYAQLVEDFAKHRAGFGNDHHPYMASLVEDVSAVSYNWAINKGYSIEDFSEFNTQDSDGKNGMEEYFEILSWSGLTSGDAFNEIYPEGSLKRKKIIDIINSESLPYESTAKPKGDNCSN